MLAVERVPPVATLDEGVGGGYMTTVLYERRVLIACCALLSLTSEALQ